ncbi:MAG: DUF5684 domain-containing protein [bacterium]|jgi:hypothetical protein
METHTTGQIIFLVALGITLLVFTIVNIVAFWQIFEKAGKPGWKSIIPVYNLLVLFDILGKPRYWFLFLLIPGLHIFIPIWMTILLGQRFQQSDLFIMGLFLFGFVFVPVLAFGDSKYTAPAPPIEGN